MATSEWVSKKHWIIRESAHDAAEFAAKLQAEGWQIYHETVPLSGQQGYYCVREHGVDATGQLIEEAKHVVWNIYGRELFPIVMDAQNERHIWDFVMTHAKHEGFGYFTWPDSNDIGFVCHCVHHKMQSYALRITEEAQARLSDEAWDFLWVYHQALSEGDGEDESQDVSEAISNKPMSELD